MISKPSSPVQPLRLIRNTSPYDVLILILNSNEFKLVINPNPIFLRVLGA